MPFSPSVVNGFVQISADETEALGYVSMAQDSISFGLVNTAYSQEKILSHRQRVPYLTKWQEESAKARNRRLTFIAVQGIIRRFPQI